MDRRSPKQSLTASERRPTSSLGLYLPTHQDLQARVIEPPPGAAPYSFQYFLVACDGLHMLLRRA